MGADGLAIGVVLVEDGVWVWNAANVFHRLGMLLRDSPLETVTDFEIRVASLSCGSNLVGVVGVVGERCKDAGEVMSRRMAEQESRPVGRRERRSY